MKMKTTLLSALLVMSGAEAYANCADAWYLRNLAFARGGYCFESNLGKELFGTNCSTKSPNLSAADKKMLSATKSYEANNGCSVATSGYFLGSVLEGKMDRVLDLPTIGYGGGICSGYIGNPIALVGETEWRSNIQVGTITAGDTIYFNFETQNDFEFVTTERGEAGWAPSSMFEDIQSKCEAAAG